MHCRLGIVVNAALLFVISFGTLGFAQTRAISAGNYRASAYSQPQIVSRTLAIVQGNQPVIRELELLDYQLKDLQELQYGFQKKINESARQLAKLAPEQRQELIEGIYREADAEIDEVLLPHQAKRLRQIAIQSLGQTANGSGVNLANLVSSRMVQKQLGISNDTINKIRQLQQEEEQRLRAEIERLRRESQERILGVLTPADRDRLQELVGEPFDFEGYTAGRGGRFRKSDDH